LEYLPAQDVTHERCTLAMKKLVLQVENLMQGHGVASKKCFACDLCKVLIRGAAVIVNRPTLRNLFLFFFQVNVRFEIITFDIAQGVMNGMSYLKLQ